MSTDRLPFSPRGPWSKSVINEAKNKFIPKVSPNSTGRRPLSAPPSLLQTLQKKRQSFKRYNKFPTTSNYKLYAQFRNQVKRESKEAKMTREQKVALDAKKNPKALFQYINTKTKGKDTIPDLIKPDGTLSLSDAENAPSSITSFLVSSLGRVKVSYQYSKGQLTKS